MITHINKAVASKEISKTRSKSEFTKIAKKDKLRRTLAMVENELGNVEQSGFNRKIKAKRATVAPAPLDIDSEPTTPKDVVKILDIAVKPKYWKKNFSTVLY